MSLGSGQDSAIYNLAGHFPPSLQHHVQPPGGSEAAFKDLATLSMGNIVLVDDQRANFQSQFGAPWRKLGWEELMKLDDIMTPVPPATSYSPRR